MYSTFRYHVLSDPCEPKGPHAFSVHPILSVRHTSDSTPSSPHPQPHTPQGKGEFTMEYAHHAPVTRDVQAALVGEAKK